MGCCSERLAIYGLELLLVAFGIIMTIGFLTTYAQLIIDSMHCNNCSIKCSRYIISVSMGHVEAYLPYIRYLYNTIIVYSTSLLIKHRVWTYKTY